MHTRSTDTVVSATIRRDVPLWSLLSLIGLAAMFWLGMYIEQRMQARAVQDLVTSLSDIRKELSEVAKELGVKNLKDVEHDLKLDDLARRMSVCESSLGCGRRANAQQQ